MKTQAITLSVPSLQRDFLSLASVDDTTQSIERRHTGMKSKEEADKSDLAFAKISKDKMDLLELMDKFNSVQLKLSSNDPKKG